MSNNTSSSSDSLSLAERYVAGTATIIIAAAALIGNGLVFCAFIKFRKLRRPTNYFIINLAVYDFLVGCLPITFWASYLFTMKPARKINEFDFIYWLWECLDILCGFGSAVSLAFVAIDRYVCIKDALRYHALVTKTRFLYCLAFIWLYSFIPVVLSYLKAKSLMPASIFRYYIFIAGLIVPVCIMAFCYLNIFLVTVRLNREMRQTQKLGTFSAPGQVWQNPDFDKGEVEMQQSAAETQKSLSATHVSPRGSRSSVSSPSKENGIPRLQQGDEDAENGSSCETYDGRSFSIVKLTKNSDDANERQRSNSEKSLAGWGNSKKCAVEGSLADRIKRNSSNDRHNDQKAEVKAAKTLSFIMGAFLLTWTPFIMAVMIYQWKMSLVKFRWTAVVKCLHYSNSGLNPFLYSILNVNFRRAFASILFCRSSTRLD